MKILIVINSTHQGNTLKIAEAMAQNTPITIAEIDNISDYNLRDYDIVGFGSGIYFGKHDEKIMEFAKLSNNDKAYTFVFSTSGSSTFEKNNKPLVDLLKSKNKIVLGRFGCKCFDKFGPFKLVGGINKGHPNETDFKEAQKFIENVMKNYENSIIHKA